MFSNVSSSEQLDTKEQLRNINLLKVYKYAYDERFANFAGLTDDEKEDTGVLAQELAEVLPDAVKETGDVVLPDGELIENFMVVNKVGSRQRNGCLFVVKGSVCLFICHFGKQFCWIADLHCSVCLHEYLLLDFSLKAFPVLGYVLMSSSLCGV